MSTWGTRPAEERALLNPGFCSWLLWHASSAYESEARHPLPFDVAFLVLPIVLHCKTRELLPKTPKTSLAVWLNDYPLARSAIADRARVLSPFIKEAMMFGGLHGLLVFSTYGVSANSSWKKRVGTVVQDATEEVKMCSKRAEFLGRWLAASGSSEAVMAIMGVRP